MVLFICVYSTKWPRGKPVVDFCLVCHIKKKKLPPEASNKIKCSNPDPPVRIILYSCGDITLAYLKGIIKS